MNLIRLIIKLVIIIIFISCGENKIIEEVKETFPDGKPKLKIFYIEVRGQKQIVKDQYFYDNGQLYGEVNYKGGTKNGKFSQYFKNGLLESEGIYKNGSRYEWTTFEYNDFKQKVAEENFDQDGDRLSRTSFVYFENGNVRSEEFYIDGAKDIHWTYYLTNGKLESAGYTLRGKKDKLWKYFLADKSYKGGIYKNGKRIGNWKFYDENDIEYNHVDYHPNKNIRTLGVMQNQKKNGKWTNYFDTGQLQSQGEFINNKEQGEWKFFLMDESYKSAEYENGMVVGDWNYFDEKGTKYNVVEYHSNKIVKTLGLKVNGEKHGRWTEYYMSGAIKSVGEFKENDRIGKWAWFHENKKLESMGLYKNGFKDGRWVVYYSNGQLKNVGEFNDRKRVGKWISYYKNGQIESEGMYLDRMKHGEWTQYYDNGKVKRIGIFEAGKLVDSQKY